MARIPLLTLPSARQTKVLKGLTCDTWLPPKHRWAPTASVGLDDPKGRRAWHFPTDCILTSYGHRMHGVTQMERMQVTLACTDKACVVQYRSNGMNVIDSSWSAALAVMLLSSPQS